jgi:hypothetical protein
MSTLAPAQREGGSLVLTERPGRVGRPADGDAESSEALCGAALEAYERLYRALDSDEPDLSANISYVVCRAVLERRGAAEPWTVPPRSAAQIRALVGRVMGTNDAQALSSWFSCFAERVLVELERRSAAPPVTEVTHRRRVGDRSSDVAIHSHPSRMGGLRQSVPAIAETSLGQRRTRSSASASGGPPDVVTGA